MTVGEKIVKLRKDNGLSQEAFGEKLNISRQAVSKWENGTAQPTSENINQISKIFNVPVSYLLNEEEVEQTKIECEKEASPKVKKNFTNIIIAFLCLVMIFQQIMIFSLNRNIDKINYNLNSINSIKSDIAELYRRIETIKLKNDPTLDYPVQTNELSNYKSEVLDYDVDTDTAKIKVSVMLAEYTDSTKVEILLKGENAEYTKEAFLENNSYNAVFDDVKCDSSFEVYCYMNDKEKKKTFYFDYISNPDELFVLTPGMCNLVYSDKNSVTLNSKKDIFTVDAEISCSLKMSQYVYPEQAYIQILNKGELIKEIVYESMIDDYKVKLKEGIESNQNEVESSHSSVGEVTYMHYLNERITGKNIENLSDVTFKVIIIDNNGKKYEIPVNH